MSNGLELWERSWGDGGDPFSADERQVVCDVCIGKMEKWPSLTAFVLAKMREGLF